MQNRKNAMTLAEIIMVLLITGVIVVMAMKVIRYVQGNYKQLYYAAYTNLKHGVGEIISNDANATIEENDPNDYTSDLCIRLTKVYDVIGTGTICGDDYDFSPSTTFAYNTPDLSKPSFVLTNGQRFYVGKFFKPVGAYNYFNKPATLVMIDLNGIAGPNVFDSKDYTDERTPDIVAFAVLEDGTVLPMSPMADRDDYIRASVQLCTYDEGCSSDLTEDIIADKVSLREAISISNSFPPRGVGSPLAVSYNDDTLYSFKVAHSVDSRCEANDTTFCKLYIYNPLTGALTYNL